jgi:hypothetical protein
MSRALPGGIGLQDGPQRIAPIRMDTLMSAAQVRNTHWTARTRFSRKSNGGATESNSLKNEWDSLREFIINMTSGGGGEVFFIRMLQISRF